MDLQAALQQKTSDYLQLYRRYLQYKKAAEERLYQATYFFGPHVAEYDEYIERILEAQRKIEACFATFAEKEAADANKMREYAYYIAEQLGNTRYQAYLFAQQSACERARAEYAERRVLNLQDDVYALRERYQRCVATVALVSDTLREIRKGLAYQVDALKLTGTAACEALSNAGVCICEQVCQFGADSGSQMQQRNQLIDSLRKELLESENALHKAQETMSQMHRGQEKSSETLYLTHASETQSMKEQIALFYEKLDSLERMRRAELEARLKAEDEATQLQVALNDYKAHVKALYLQVYHFQRAPATNDDANLIRQYREELISQKYKLSEMLEKNNRLRSLLAKSKDDYARLQSQYQQFDTNTTIVAEMAARNNELEHNLYAYKNKAEKAEQELLAAARALDNSQLEAAYLQSTIQKLRSEYYECRDGCVYLATVQPVSRSNLSKSRGENRSVQTTEFSLQSLKDACLQCQTQEPLTSNVGVYACDQELEVRLREYIADYEALKLECNRVADAEAAKNAELYERLETRQQQCDALEDELKALKTAAAQQRTSYESVVARSEPVLIQSVLPATAHMFINAEYFQQIFDYLSACSTDNDLQSAQKAQLWFLEAARRVCEMCRRAERPRPVELACCRSAYILRMLPENARLSLMRAFDACEQLNIQRSEAAAYQQMELVVSKLGGDLPALCRGARSLVYLLDYILVELRHNHLMQRRDAATGKRDIADLSEKLARSQIDAANKELALQKARDECDKLRFEARYRQNYGAASQMQQFNDAKINEAGKASPATLLELKHFPAPNNSVSGTNATSADEGTESIHIVEISPEAITRLQREKEALLEVNESLRYQLKAMGNSELKPDFSDEFYNASDGAQQENAASRSVKGTADPLMDLEACRLKLSV